MRFFRVVGRALFFVLFAFAIILRVRWYRMQKNPDINAILDIRRRWTRHFLLPVLGVRVHTKGTPPGFPCIVMANHRSYLDPAVICRDVPGMPVAKAEVERWPVIGPGVRDTGILFLHRESQHSRQKTLVQIGEKVREGIIVLLFPEGTTHAQPNTIPFRRGAFQMAAEAGITIVPVAVEFRNPADYWTGDDQFLPHFFQRFGEKNTEVFVHYGPALQSLDADDLLEKTQAWIDTELQEIRKEFF